MAERPTVNHSACSFSSPRPLGRFSCPPKWVVSLCCSGRGSMSEHTRKDDIIRRVVSALQTAPSGSQELDCMISYRSEEHKSELQSLMRISYAVFCLKKQQHNMTY